MVENYEKQARLWGMLCHLTALLPFFGVPFGNVLGPLVVWLIKKDDYSFVDQQGKESLNFQISLLLYSIISVILIIVVVGIILLIGLLISYIMLVIVASIKTSNGEPYRYPFTIRFIK